MVTMPTGPSTSVSTNSYGIRLPPCRPSLARSSAADRASRGPDWRYRVVKRRMLLFAPAVALLLLPLTVRAKVQPFKTVVDNIVPKTAGLTIQGTAGGCDLTLQNQSGQDVILLDMSKPPKPFRFAAQPKTATPRPPIPVHLPAAGVWPCASLPAVNEDQRWNHAETTVGIWSVNGTVGALSFKLTARTVYDPTLDPPSDWTLYLRWGAGIAVAGGVLIAIPYLFTKRREILEVTTTHIGLSQGRQEMNGIAAWIIQNNGELAVYALKLSLVAALVGFLLVFGRSRAVWNAYLIAAWITTFAVINNVYRLLS